MNLLQRWISWFLMWLGLALVVVMIRVVGEIYLMRYLVGRIAIFNQQIMSDWLEHFREQIVLECCIAALFAGFAASAHTVWAAKHGCRAELNRLEPPP